MKSIITAICEEFSDHFVEEPNEVVVFVNMRHKQEMISRLECLGCKLVKDTKKFCFNTLLFSKPTWKPTKYLG